MIEFYDKPISGKSYTESVCRFTEELDTLILKSNHPTIGVVRILSLVLEVTEGTGYILEKSFRYTLDGLNWSEWIELSELVLTNLDIKKNHFFDIEYKFICKKIEGSEEYSFPEFKSVQIIFDYEIPKEPDNYKDHFFNKYLSFYNYNSLKWTFNVLEKIYKSGILAKYIERKNNKNWCDEDFIDFWWSIVYFLSLRLSYNEVYTNLYWYPELLRKYLEGKGIYFGSETKLSECIYLMYYYYNEICKRGSISVLSSSEEGLRGELLRLIDKRDIDEFLAVLLPSEENGWIVGKTCPLFSETDFYKGYIKGYEFGSDIIDLSKYPILETSNYDILNYKGHKSLHFKSSGEIGSKDGQIPLSKLFVIDPSFSYEISLRFRTNSKKVSIVAGAKTRDRAGIEVDNPFDQDNNLAIQGELIVPNIDNEHYLSFTILGKNEDYCKGCTEEYFSENSSYVRIIQDGSYVTQNNFGVIFNDVNGESFAKRNLQFKLNDDYSKYLDPFIQLQGDIDSDFYVWDIKVRLLDRKPIFITSMQEMLLYLKNNNYLYSLKELREIIETYLVPFVVNLTFVEYE